MIRLPDRRVLIIVAIAILAILGIGVVTFVFGPDADEAERADDYVELDFGTVQGSPRPAEEVLFLAWGDGEAEVVRKGDLFERSTVEAAFASEGLVFVVDHPQDVFGARVRWFSEQGELLGRYDTPPGSTLFGPHEGGFHYVIAKSGGPSERAVLYDVDSSRPTTYTIPLGLNSGGLHAEGNTLYARVSPSEVDLDEERVYAREAIVPVAIDGLQVDDPSAEIGIRDAWGVGRDGEEYTLTTEIMGLDPALSEVVTVVGSDAGRVRVPRRYRILGVDETSAVYLRTLPLPEIGQVRQDAAGWLSSFDPLTEVLVIRMDGTVDSVIGLPYGFLATWNGAVPVAFASDGLYSVREAEGGVSVVRHALD